MAMTLSDMKVGMTDKVAQQVVDIFLRESEVLQLLPFDNCISPNGGSTLTYAYLQKKLPPPLPSVRWAASTPQPRQPWNARQPT